MRLQVVGLKMKRNPIFPLRLAGLPLPSEDSRQVDMRLRVIGLDAKRRDYVAPGFFISHLREIIIRQIILGDMVAGGDVDGVLKKRPAIGPVL